MNEEINYIKRCITLAENGLGNVAPNPMVGCVIVHNGRIIAEGYHREYGSPHAEVNAINSVKDTELLKSSTLFVNLEPCVHFGKTPPCTDLIIRIGIPKVVIGNVDTYREVAGKGIRKLKSAGIEVISGILDDECRELNRRFFTYHEKKRPYIILKWAQTSDGFIGINRDINAEAKPVWISSEEIRVLVHKWRTEEQSIMVGTNTALLDNPRLNARDWTGKSPIRIVLDKNLRLPASLHLFDGSIPTIVLTSHENSHYKSNKAEYIGINFKNNLANHVCEALYKKKIQSVIIEGGGQFLQSFIDAGIWDEARIVTGDIKFHGGVKAPEIAGIIKSETYFKNNKLTILKNRASLKTQLERHCEEGTTEAISIPKFRESTLHKIASHFVPHGSQ
ncbi:MAG: bifunctional diaminohydroxyphosphoribosylaminopyrimidine deaminase/5-amino-6-(5-phosphoribosylamino)uracil reductase RibD [Bacteroidales bacterium]